MSKIRSTEKDIETKTRIVEAILLANSLLVRNPEELERKMNQIFTMIITD